MPRHKRHVKTLKAGDYIGFDVLNRRSWEIIDKDIGEITFKHIKGRFTVFSFKRQKIVTVYTNEINRIFKDKAEALAYLV